MKSTETNERGAAALELALILPILVLLVFGIIEFGRGYNANVEIQGAVREGARSLSLGGTTSQAESTVQAAASNLTPITFSNETTCSPRDGASVPPKNATITATYNLSYNIPLFKSGAWTITATGVIRCET
jgi:Flp pilus assembly protein TadG